MKRINTNHIVSLSAILISLGSLFVIVYQTSLMQSAQRASVFPYLTIGMKTNSEREVIGVANRGLGPALIKSVRVIDDQGTFEGGIYPYLRERLGDRFAQLGDINIDLLLPGRLVSPNEVLEVFSHSRSDTLSRYLFENFVFPFDERGTAVVEVEYESVYGDRWRVRSDEYVPAPID